MNYNKSNYYIQTFAVFKACKKPKRTPDYTSNSLSSYWYGVDSKGAYVIRYSDHWSKNNGATGCLSVASCWWEIKGKFLNNCGKAYFKQFRRRI